MTNINLDPPFVPTYTLNVANGSTVPTGAAVLYQAPGGSPAVLSSLAWNVTTLTSTMQAITIPTDWSFFWTTNPTSVPPLVPGVVVALESATTPTSGFAPAAFSLSNQVAFSMATGAYTFATPGTGPVSNVLSITEDYTIPVQQATIGFGLGMSTASTPAPIPLLAAAAGPNLTVTYTPPASVSFGLMFDTTGIVVGQVLQPGAATFATQVTFAPGIYTMYATFNGNGWTVTDVPS